MHQLLGRQACAVVSSMPQETEGNVKRWMGTVTRMEGREVRAVGHGAKQTECGTQTNACFNKLALCWIPTSPLCHHREKR